MAPKTIFLKGDPIRIEGKAGEAITPGMLVYRSATDELKKHGSSGGNTPKIFAIEDSLQGKEIGDDYESGSRVQAEACRQNDEVYAWLKDGETVALNGALESAGDGTLQALTSGMIVGYALEALDLSASAISAAQRIKIAVA